MKKYINISLKIMLSLILTLPILGALGIFPPPTQDLYNTKKAFDFILMLEEIKYITYIMVTVFVVSIGLVWTKRVSLAALLILPITVNIVGFHAFLDGGLFTGGAIPANILLGLNIYFLWHNKDKYKSLI